MGLDKRKLHHVLVVLRHVKMRQLLVLLVILVALSTYFLRQNNLHMIELRNLVTQADEQNQAVSESLTNLRNYVTVHMNTGMGETGLYLGHSYQRAYSQAVQSAIQAGGASAIIYQHADQVCQGQIASSFQAYIQCMSDEIAASGSPSISAPSADLYHYNFISPAWSPDVAGITLFAAMLSTILIASQLVLTWGVRLLLRSRL